MPKHTFLVSLDMPDVSLKEMEAYIEDAVSLYGRSLRTMDALFVDNWDIGSVRVKHSTPRRASKLMGESYQYLRRVLAESMNFMAHNPTCASRRMAGAVCTCGRDNIYSMGVVALHKLFGD